MTELKDKIKAIAQRAKKTGFAYSNFFGIDAITQVVAVAKENGLQYIMYGGYPEAERFICCMYDYKEDFDFPISIIKIESRITLQHRQVLGTVLSLGIVRDLLGDIIINDEASYLFCINTIAEHICSSIYKIGGVGVKLSTVDSLEIINKNSGELKRTTVSSPRLDAVVSSYINLSRNKAEILISQSRICINNALCTKPDKKIAENDIISIKGFGRLIIKEISDVTRKGRYPIIAEVFINKR